MSKFFSSIQQKVALSKVKVTLGFLKFAKWGVAALLVLILSLFILDTLTSYLVRDRVYTEIDQLPKREYAVVLGTAKYYPSRGPNLYYKYRLEAAKQLYEHSKADYLLMSGDNKTPYYNEPKVMTNDLSRMGVSVNHILQDYAGYNTLDSVVRAHKVFGLEKFTIVSQRFHCERALFIAKIRQIDAICFAAKYPEQHYKVRIREVFARAGMLIQLLLGVEPTTLAESKIVEVSK